MISSHLKQYLIGFAASTFAAAGMACGWAAPVMIRLQSNNSEIQITADEGSWVIASLEIGDIFTPIPAGFTSDRFGRKPVIWSIVPMYLIGWCLLIATRSYKMLIIARLIFGLCMGIIYSICPLYLGEITEPQIRGKITSFCTVMLFIGMLSSYSVAPYVSYNTLSYICISLPTVLAFVLYFIPESPYNLVMRGKYEKAKTEMRKIRSGNDTFILNEIKLVKAAIHEQTAEKMPCSALVTDPVCRMSVILIFIIAVTGLLGGRSIMYAYATEILSSAEITLFSADQGTIILGIIFLILSVFSTLVVDKFGRRPLLLISAGGSGVSHLVSGIYFFVQKKRIFNVSDYSWILLLATGGYCIFASIGLGPISPVYQSEIFPNGIKSIASGTFITAMCFFSLFALKMFHFINSNFGVYFSFWLLSFINLSGSVLMYIYLIETKGKSLVVIQNELKILCKISKPKADVNETVSFKI
ncbi:facilitated trehalose transporter Tret1-like isoform X2 [Lycorma delicatula]|uniref:facilitated trehalose transporter Tret1-like isoform X2 n=1 Tax=Lycorma delicatula TaxID=130591 RepID=UPI003F51A503